MDWFVPQLFVSLLSQVTPSVQDLAQEVEALKAQIETLQNTNQLLSDGLTNQIEFLKQENQSLTNSFSQYVNAMRWNLTVLAGLAAILTAVGGWIFKNNLDDAKQVAQEIIDRRVEGQIGELVNARVEEVARTLRREQVIGSTLVDYYLPDGGQPPHEVALLRARRFQKVRLVRSQAEMRRSPGDVVVLDVQNWVLPSGQRFMELPEPEREAQAERQIAGLLDVLPLAAVVVVYVRGRIGYLNRVGDRYVLPANNPVTLVGTVADGAYVARGERQA